MRRAVVIERGWGPVFGLPFPEVWRELQAAGVVTALVSKQAEVRKKTGRANFAGADPGESAG